MLGRLVDATTMTLLEKMPRQSAGTTMAKALGRVLGGLLLNSILGDTRPLRTSSRAEKGRIRCPFGRALGMRPPSKNTHLARAAWPEQDCACHPRSSFRVGEIPNDLLDRVCGGGI